MCFQPLIHLHHCFAVALTVAISNCCIPTSGVARINEVQCALSRSSLCDHRPLILRTLRNGSAALPCQRRPHLMTKKPTKQTKQARLTDIHQSKHLCACHMQLDEASNCGASPEDDKQKGSLQGCVERHEIAFVGHAEIVQEVTTHLAPFKTIMRTTSTSRECYTLTTVLCLSTHRCETQPETSMRSSAPQALGAIHGPCTEWADHTVVLLPVRRALDATRT